MLQKKLNRILRKQNSIKSVAAVILALMAILAIPVYLTGEPAEELVEKLPGVSEAMIELHEDAATIAIWLMGVTGVAAILALFLAWQKRKATNIFFAITFLLSVVCFAAMAHTSYYGGQIRHTEIRKGDISNQQNQHEKEVKEKDKDND